MKERNKGIKEGRRNEEAKKKGKKGCNSITKDNT